MYRSHPMINSCSALALPLAIGLVIGFPSAGLSHSKGIYQSKADAEQRAKEIDCTSPPEQRAMDALLG